MRVVKARTYRGYTFVHTKFNPFLPGSWEGILVARRDRCLAFPVSIGSLTADTGWWIDDSFTVGCLALPPEVYVWAKRTFFAYVKLLEKGN